MSPTKEIIIGITVAMGTLVCIYIFTKVYAVAHEEHRKEIAAIKAEQVRLRLELEDLKAALGEGPKS